MKWFWRYAFPVVFGLLIYFSIRVVTDTNDGTKFWLRPWKQNAIEIVCVVIITCITLPFLHKLVQQFSKRTSVFNIGNVMREFFIILLVALLSMNPMLFFIHYLIEDPVTLSDFSIANVVVALYILLYYSIARGNNFVQAYIDQQLKLERITNDQLQTELKFLKAQYHPHFLFNALNTIYFQMDEDLPGAKRSIEQFSGLLRYQLYDQQQTVTISKELGYLQQFIDLQKIRSSEKLQLSVNFDPGLQQQQLYPLLLLPLVENAFKYAGGSWTIDINATLENDHLEFTVANAVPSEVPQHSASGIGLENVKRRLDLLYPGNAKLDVKRENDTFIAKLIIPLH
ncbi:sensor histidine kinase [Pseudobacter ginsenosidimutans]|uniref:Histidine kinase n=1 Tax=Pseudobacter ginsenosidimutans TaxID=661488 RepID=A0A4Q7N3P3_9BACT|nr:sensor histidine kinase [Pseudobacter ginsenosidimutans]QEC44148.1 sensor histidine kinase [Pseudobacter ginsenosidimutans]RZS75596.1 histidine kinase [Pseudobacter ginsenosidimutans]